MNDELASVRGIVDLSPQDALDSAQAFLMRQAYQVVQRGDTALTVSRRKREGMWGHSLPYLTVSATPQPSGGVRIKFMGNDREGLQERQAAFVEWSKSLPKTPEAPTDEPETSSAR